MMTTIISTRQSTEAFSPNERMIHEMSLLALNNNYYYEYQRHQLDDDDKSDSTTTIVDSPKRFIQEGWTDPHKVKSTQQQPETPKMSLCFSSPTSPTQPSLSRLSLFKSRVKRAFRFQSTSSSSLSSSPSSNCHITSKPSLPVISPAKWSPPVESTMHSDNYHKSCRYRHSMDTIQQLEPKQPRRFSSATRLKDRLGRSSSLSAMGKSKSILKTASREELQFKKQRWPSPSRRLSMPLKKKCSIMKRKSKGVSFNKMVDVFETYSKEDYDRSSDADAVCTRLTAMVAHQIKQELNYYKLNEMIVHESSRLHTHFFL